MKFNKIYFALTVIFFLIEVFIALYIKDNFIRPYFGDVLVVILIYCFVKSFFDFPKMQTAIGVLAFAFLIEFLQYLNIVSVLGLEHNKIARVVIGTSFAWEDILCYIVGIAFVLLVEKRNPFQK
jgi:hypothetical protein